MPGPAYTIRLTRGAERDLEAIYDYLAASRSADDAAALLDAILAKADTLEQWPKRGAVPAELSALGIEEYRQILHRHFRIIYRIVEDNVFVAVIADGRRDMRALLERRLLADRD
ncbi:MAG: type II toxin-antitoxin system RelE/ParE family toxin [Sphingomonadaceae bacterium]|nr:type II toxin-antitoxin system RelE/ParE family toxin [Sphingomonadaceae bacterium]